MTSVPENEAILTEREFAVELAPLWRTDDVAADKVTRHDQALRRDRDAERQRVDEWKRRAEQAAETRNLVQCRYEDEARRAIGVEAALVSERAAREQAEGEVEMRGDRIEADRVRLERAEAELRLRDDKHPLDRKIRWECRHSELPEIDAWHRTEGETT